MWPSAAYIRIIKLSIYRTTWAKFHILTFFICTLPHFSCCFAERNKTILRVCAHNRCIRMHLHTRFWRDLFEVFCLCSSRWILISCSHSLGFTNKAELYCPLPFYARSRLSFIYFELYIFRFRDALTLPFFVSPRRWRKYFYGRFRELHSPMNLRRPRIRNWADAWNSKRRAGSLLEYVIAIVTRLFYLFL